MGSVYYTEFAYKATGLPKILSEFRAAAKEIEATSKSMGKINFMVNDASLKKAAESAQVLSRELTKLGTTGTGNLSATFTKLESTLSKVEQSVFNLVASMDKIGASSANFSKVSSSASTAASSIGRVSTATNTAATSSTRLATSLSEVGASVSRSATSFVSFSSSAAKAFTAATGEAIKFAATMSGAVVGSIERAGAAMMGLGASAARMGASGLAGAMAMPKNAAMWAAPMATSLMQTLLSPEVLLGLGGGYSLYSASGLEKTASAAAAKSGAYGADANQIKQIVTDVANSFGGKSVYTPNAVAQGELSYAAMGGKLTDLNTTKGVMQNTLDFAQAVTMDVAPAMELLYSQALNWVGFQAMQGPEASAAIQKQADALTVLSNQTRLNANDLGNALKSVTSVAATSGMSQEQTYAAVGTMSQLGRNPEQAGTDIRRLMLRLTPSYNALQQEEADQMGLWTDAKGKEKDLSALNEGLKTIGLTYKDINLEANKGDLAASIKKIDSAMTSKGWDKLTQESFLKTLLGVQGTTPFYLLGQESGQKTYYDLLNKLLGSEGAAAKGAKTATDNLRGSVSKLLSHIVANANAIGEKLIPGATKLANYLNESAIPTLEKFGTAIASGDWTTVGDMFEGLIDSIQNGAESLSESFKNLFTGDALKGSLDWIGDIWDSIDWDQMGRTWDNVVEGLTGAFETASTWLQGRIDSIDWGNVESRLGTALDAAGTWLENKINGINWDTVGTKIGNVLTWAGGILEKVIKAIPWGSILTALTNAITAAVMAVNWPAAFSGALNAASGVGKAIYDGVANSGLGVYLQNIAINFRNSITGAINDASMALADLAMAGGLSPKTVIETTGGIKAKISEIADTAYNKIDAARKTENIGPIVTATIKGLGQSNIPILNTPLEERAKESTTIEKWATGLWDTFFGENKKSSLGAGELEPEPAPASAQIDISQISTMKSQRTYPDSFYNTTQGLTAPSSFLTTDPAAEKELRSFSNYLENIKLPAYKLGTQECLQDYEFAKNGYRNYVLRTSDESDNEYWKDINLVNLEDSYHYIPGMTPAGLSPSFPQNTHIFDPRIASDRTDIPFYEGTISNLPGYKGESSASLIPKYTKNPKNVEEVWPSEEYDFSPNTMKIGEHLNFPIQAGISGASNPKKSLFGSGAELSPSDAAAVAGNMGGTPTIDYSQTPSFASQQENADALTQSGGGYVTVDAGFGEGGDGGDTGTTPVSTSSAISTPTEAAIQAIKDYVNQEREPYYALEAFKNDPAGTIGNFLLGKDWETPLSPVTVENQQPGVPGQMGGGDPTVAKQTVKALEDQPPVIEEQTKAIKDSSNLISYLPDELQSAFKGSVPDYNKIADYMTKEYSSSNKAKDYEKFDNRIKETSDDLIATLFAGMGITAAELVKIKEKADKIDENTNGTKENTKGLKGFDTKSLKENVFGTPSLGTIKDDYSGALGTGAGTGTGAYGGGAVRIGIDENGRQVAVIGQVRQSSWAQERGKRWAEQSELSGTSKNALSVGNSIVKVQMDTSDYDSKKAELGKGISKQITPVVQLGGYYAAKAEIQASVTKFVNVVTNYMNNNPSVAAGTTKPFSVNPANVPTQTITFKKYHSGGVTPGNPNQEMLALVRGQERITPINSGNRNSGGGDTIIHVHAEGAIFAGNRGITQLAEEISRISNDRMLYISQ